MAITVWAFAKAGVAAQTLFEATRAEAVRRLREFNCSKPPGLIYYQGRSGEEEEEETSRTEGRRIVAGDISFSEKEEA